MRFSNDIYAVDDALPELWDTLVYCAFDVRKKIIFRSVLIFSLLLALVTQIAHLFLTINIKRFVQCINVFVAAIMAFGTDILPRIAQLSSAQKLHNFLVNNLFRVPIKFHETVPVGRILSRVSKDIEVLDFTLPETVFWWLNCFWEVNALSLFFCEFL